MDSRNIQHGGQDEYSIPNAREHNINQEIRTNRSILF